MNDNDKLELLSRFSSWLVFNGVKLPCEADVLRFMETQR